ncbi:MAG: hypothetical protein IJI38_04830 [Clostridia bacterium]|nr:hypothetical protein [Clostridia bacterium]
MNTEMNTELNQELNLDSMEKATGAAIVKHEGKYWVVEEPPTQGDFLYYRYPFNTVEEAEEKARSLGWSTGWFTVRSFEAIYGRKLQF